MPTITPQLDRTVTRFRGPIARGLAAGNKSPIDPAGGMFGAGLISGFAICTRGEALGHYMWIDGIFLDQLSEAMGAMSKGLKSRFTHPDMSGDSLGTYLGRANNEQLSGDVLRGDLHFAKIAHETPDGDLANYVMGFAKEDPEAFGSSIVFLHDWESEDLFYEENQQPVTYTDDKGREYERIEFRSPDPLNTENLPHCRLRELCAVDIVDDPAANPGGLFHRTTFAHDAEKLAAFALGLSTEAPATSALGIDPDRLAGFAARFLAHHQLEIVPMTTKLRSAAAELAAGKPAPGKITGKLAAKKAAPAPEPAKDESTDSAAEAPAADPEDVAEGEPEEPDDAPPAEPKKKTPAPSAQAAADPKAAFNADLKKFTAKFGAENGSKWLSEGKTYEQALELHCEVQADELRAAQESAAELQSTIDSLALGETKPLSARPDGAGAAAEKFAHLGANASKVCAAFKFPGQ